MEDPVIKIFKKKRIQNVLKKWKFHPFSLNKMSYLLHGGRKPTFFGNLKARAIIRFNHFMALWKVCDNRKQIRQRNIAQPFVQPFSSTDWHRNEARFLTYKVFKVF